MGQRPPAAALAAPGGGAASDSLCAVSRAAPDSLFCRADGSPSSGSSRRPIHSATGGQTALPNILPAAARRAGRKAVTGQPAMRASSDSVGMMRREKGPASRADRRGAVRGMVPQLVRNGGLTPQASTGIARLNYDSGGSRSRPRSKTFA